MNTIRRRGLKILYLGMHEVQEYDDLSMLTSLGHSVFSLGAYREPGFPGVCRRPKPVFFADGDYAAFIASGSTDRADVRPEFAARFDMVIANHYLDWVEAALGYMGGRPVVYRSIGQSTLESEARLAAIRDRVTVVRYGEGDTGLPGFVDSDATIYFGKDPLEFGEPWQGGDRFVTFHNYYRLRAYNSAPSIPQYEELGRSFPLDLFGLDNEGIAVSRGLLPAERQADALRHAAGYVYVPSVPPSYTLSFVEALGVGTPVVAPSAAFIQNVVAPQHISASAFSEARWEVPRLLGADSGLVYDDLDGARAVMERLRSDRGFASESSARMLAIFRQYFDAAKISREWDALLQTIMRDRAPAAAGRDGAA